MKFKPFQVKMSCLCYILLRLSRVFSSKQELTLLAPLLGEPEPRGAARAGFHPPRAVCGVPRPTSPHQDRLLGWTRAKRAVGSGQCQGVGWVACPARCSSPGRAVWPAEVAAVLGVELGWGLLACVLSGLPSKPASGTRLAVAVSPGGTSRLRVPAIHLATGDRRAGSSAREESKPQPCHGRCTVSWGQTPENSVSSSVKWGPRQAGACGVAGTGPLSRMWVPSLWNKALCAPGVTQAPLGSANINPLPGYLLQPAPPKASC